jgi:hypothetical protein
MNIAVRFLAVLLLLQTPAFCFDGFQNAAWGSSPDAVKKANSLSGWSAQPAGTDFPKELGVSVFVTQQNIAGKNASVKYYFYNDKFFQATATFNFDELKNYDFNYNVYRSVNEYYTAIRTKTILFVNDIYDLLRKKYGEKEPVFTGLDPRSVFAQLDRYVLQERWNLRYHPYDFYCTIVTSSYARWDFQHTRVLFSLNIAAAQKRFDYQLSLSSNDIAGPLRRAIDAARSKGL